MAVLSASRSPKLGLGPRLSPGRAVKVRRFIAALIFAAVASIALGSPFSFSTNISGLPAVRGMTWMCRCGTLWPTPLFWTIVKPSTPRPSTWAWPTRGGHGHQPRQVLGRDFQQVAGLGGLGDHQHMARFGRGVVHEGWHLVVLVDLGHDDLAAQDAGEGVGLIIGALQRDLGRADLGRAGSKWPQATAAPRPPARCGCPRSVVGVHVGFGQGFGLGLAGARPAWGGGRAGLLGADHVAAGGRRCGRSGPPGRAWSRWSRSPWPAVQRWVPARATVFDRMALKEAALRVAVIGKVAFPCRYPRRRSASLPAAQGSGPRRWPP